MKPIFGMILLLTLSACGQQTFILPTETPTPIAVPPTLVPTSTSISVPITPSPLPTQPIVSMITPDAFQVERWKEYEDALAKALFRSSFIPGEFVCEWEFLGQSDQEVYIWTDCMSIFSVGSYHATMPVVIHIGVNGSIKSVKIPGGGSSYASDIRQMFPPEAQEKYFGQLIHFQELEDRLRWRRGHPEEPPLIILNSLSTQPTPAIIPKITPEPIQVER